MILTDWDYCQDTIKNFSKYDKASIESVSRFTGVIADSHIVDGVKVAHKYYDFVTSFKEWSEYKWGIKIPILPDLSRFMFFLYRYFDRLVKENTKFDDRDLEVFLETRMDIIKKDREALFSSDEKQFGQTVRFAVSDIVGSNIDKIYCDEEIIEYFLTLEFMKIHQELGFDECFLDEEDLYTLRLEWVDHLNKVIEKHKSKQQEGKTKKKDQNNLRLLMKYGLEFYQKLESKEGEKYATSMLNKLPSDWENLENLKKEVADWKAKGDRNEGV